MLLLFGSGEGVNLGDARAAQERCHGPLSREMEKVENVGRIDEIRHGKRGKVAPPRSMPRAPDATA